MGTQSQYASFNKNMYNKYKYDRVSIVMKASARGENRNKAALRRIAAEHGMSVNAFVIFCINTVAGEDIIDVLDDYSRRPMQVSRV